MEVEIALESIMSDPTLDSTASRLIRAFVATSACVGMKQSIKIYRRFDR